MTRYESGPGRSIILARLKGTGSAKPLLLLHHMDVVPTDPSRWKHAPFGAEIADGNIWGRGTMDMKGLGGRPAHGVPVAEAAERPARP